MSSNLGRVGYIVLLPFTMTRRFLGWVLASLALSNRGRRMLLAVSLYAHLKHIDTNELNDETIRAIAHDINELFRLVRTNEKALIIPIVLHNSIWRGVKLPNEDELRLFPVKDSCRKIRKSVPAWLRYDDKVMADDIALIVRKYVGRKIVQ